MKKLLFISVCFALNETFVSSFFSKKPLSSDSLKSLVSFMKDNQNKEFSRDNIEEYWNLMKDAFENYNCSNGVSLDFANLNAEVYEFHYDILCHVRTMVDIEYIYYDLRNMDNFALFYRLHYSEFYEKNLILLQKWYNEIKIELNRALQQKQSSESENQEKQTSKHINLEKILIIYEKMLYAISNSENSYYQVVTILLYATLTHFEPRWKECMSPSLRDLIETNQKVFIEYAFDNQSASSGECDRKFITGHYEILKNGKTFLTGELCTQFALLAYSILQCTDRSYTADDVYESELKNLFYTKKNEHTKGKKLEETCEIAELAVNWVVYKQKLY